MNFSGISSNTFLGKLLRLPLRLLPPGMVMPILQGRMRGMKWVVGSGEHGYWLGWYEYRKRQSFEREIKPNSVFFDIGANVGYFSLLAAKLSKPKGHVYAFEPLPRNIKFIHKHIALNHLAKYISVIEAAVSDKNGSAHFDLGASTAMGHISYQGQLEVQLVSLDELYSKDQIPAPDYIKVDVEGAEYEVLNGARRILQTRRPILFLDTHARSAHDKTVALLQELGYSLECIDGKALPDSKEILAKPMNEFKN